jgi:hypothetical protein
MPVPEGVPQVGRFTNPKIAQGRYQVLFPGEAIFTVRSETGDVTMFTNTRKQRRQVRNASDAPPLIKDAFVARSHLRDLMSRIGMDSNCELTNLVCRLPSDPDMVDPANLPRASASFEPKPYGYRLQGGYGRHVIYVDPVDGGVMDYSRRPERPYRIESHEPKLSAKEAREKAAPYVKKFDVGKRLGGPPGAVVRPATKRTELMFVCPNGDMGGITYDLKQNPVVLRLAWVLIYPQDDEVWIDAGDGKLLGGLRHGAGGWK